MKMTNENCNNRNVMLLVHTMTITEINFTIEAQFFHAYNENCNGLKLIWKRMRYILNSQQHQQQRGLRRKRNLLRLQRINFKDALKRKTARIKHHLRTISFSGSPRANIYQNDPIVDSSPPPPPQPTHNSLELQRNNNNTNNNNNNHSNGSISPTTPPIDKKLELTNTFEDQLASFSTPQQTVAWLIRNRFEKYCQTFESFSGADMLRMSRDDLMQICGQADGIRLYNAIHLKVIAPRLKIYVCRENTTVFNAIFLSSHNNLELMEKLSILLNVPYDQVKDVYMEGPQAIHVQLNSDVMRHIKEETMFSVEILPDNGSLIFLLKRTRK